MLSGGRRRVFVQDKSSRGHCGSCSSDSCHCRYRRRPLLFVRAADRALGRLRLLVVVVPVSVVVNMAEDSLRLLLSAARFVHHRIQRAGPSLWAHLQAVPAGGVALPVVHERVIVTTEGAAEGGPAAVHPLQGHVSAVEDRVAGRAVARPRAGVTGWPVSQVAAAHRVVAASRAAAVLLAAVGQRPVASLRCRGAVVQPGAGRAALGSAGRAVVVAGPPRGVVVATPAVPAVPVGPPGALGRKVVPAAGAQWPAGEEAQRLAVSWGGAGVVAQRGVGPRGSARVVGPHGERDSVLGEGVAAWTAVRLRVKETLALLWTVVQSAPLGLTLRPCGKKKQQMRKFS